VAEVALRSQKAPWICELNYAVTSNDIHMKEKLGIKARGRQVIGAECSLCNFRDWFPECFVVAIGIIIMVYTITGAINIIERVRDASKEKGNVGSILAQATLQAR